MKMIILKKRSIHMDSFYAALQSNIGRGFNHILSFPKYKNVIAKTICAYGDKPAFNGRVRRDVYYLDRDDAVVAFITFFQFDEEEHLIIGDYIETTAENIEESF